MIHQELRCLQIKPFFVSRAYRTVDQIQHFMLSLISARLFWEIKLHHHSNMILEWSCSFISQNVRIVRMQTYSSNICKSAFCDKAGSGILYRYYCAPSNFMNLIHLKIHLKERQFYHFHPWDSKYMLFRSKLLDKSRPSFSKDFVLKVGKHKITQIL